MICVYVDSYVCSRHEIILYIMIRFFNGGVVDGKQ